MTDRLEQIKTERAVYGRIEDMDDEVAALIKVQDWLIAEVDRYREALRRISHYDVEAHHGPVDEWAEAEAFAAVSEIAAGALYYWEKRARGGADAQA